MPQITLAIHTYRYALGLKSLLESEGIAAALQNVNLSEPGVNAGVRVRIDERDLPKALRIIENPDIFNPEASSDKAKHNKLIIAPVDFSNAGENALAAAFSLAERHGARVLLLHAYLSQSLSEPVDALSDDLDFGETPEAAEAAAEVTADIDALMRRYAARVREQIKSGSIAAAPFDTLTVDGLPEEVINEVAKERNPMLIVMGTHGAGNHERAAMGSVTAEVLDTCRYPVLTVPVGNREVNFKRVLFFTTPDQQDIVALDTFLRLSGPEGHDITLLAIPSRGRTSGSSLEAMTQYCLSHYPGNTFASEVPPETSLTPFLETVAGQTAVDIIGVPNKRKNSIVRFFNPTIAHRLLYLADHPMLVIPV